MSFVNYPYTIGWGITNRCNLRCSHCNMDSGNKMVDELSFDEVCALIDEFAEHNVKNISFTGGEPFTRSDFLEICEYAMSKGIYVCVTTNGTLLNDTIINEYLYKFQLVRVSIDGVDATQHDEFRKMNGTYNKAIENIKKMIGAGCDVGVVTCVSKLNIQDIESIASNISSIGVKKWFLPLLSPSGRGKNIEEYALEPEEVKRFLLDINEYKVKYNLEIGVDIPYAAMLPEVNHKNNNVIFGTCAAAITQVMIFANGDISPCFAMKMRCGNVREDKLEDIWNNNKVFCEFRNKDLLEGKCKNCSFLKQCGGGCRAVPYIISGNYLGEDSVCWKK